MKGINKTKKNAKKSSIPKREILSWFEIPVLNLERGMAFYSSVLETSFETTQTATHAMAFFSAESGVNGALVFGDGCVPSITGSLLYFNVASNLEQILLKVQDFGGQVLMGKTLISEDVGFYSLILDSEGNRIALNSKN